MNRNKILNILSIYIMYTFNLYSSESYSHIDWEMVCDNTNRCKIAGYSSNDMENKYHKVSVLFDKKAGKNVKTKGFVQLENLYEAPLKFTKPIKLELLINSKSYGFVKVNTDYWGRLNQMQINSILKSFHESSDIRFVYKNFIYKLSDKGSSAVLLKADEYQKRVGTIGALYAIGKKDEKGVLKAKKMPKIYAKVSKFKELKIKHNSKKYKELKKIFNIDKKLEKDSCYMPSGNSRDLTIYTIDNKKIIVTTQCWMAAYNWGDIVWVANKKLPYHKKIVTTDASDIYSSKKGIIRIDEMQKGRGIGDCLSHVSYVWNGKEFKLTNKSTTGKCRAIQAGGTWDLPTFVSEVIKK